MTPGSLQSSREKQKTCYLISQGKTELTQIWEHNDSDQELKSNQWRVAFYPNSKS